MRRGIHPHAVRLNGSNVNQLHGLNFVFICIDEGPPKRDIVTFLEANSTAFIDVGMGVHIGDNNLLGVLRATTSTPAKRDQFAKLVSFAENKNEDYETNIQIADLNMFNAALAVIKWKKLCGFYQDLQGEHNCTYSINVNQLLSDEADT